MIAVFYERVAKASFRVFPGREAQEKLFWTSTESLRKQVGRKFLIQSWMKFSPG